MWIFGKSAKVSMYSVNSEIFVSQQMERKTAKDRRKSRYICHCNCWAPVSQTENVKRKVLHGGRKSIVTSEGTCKKPSLFCLYPRSWKGAAHQSLSPWGLNSCLFADGLHHSADTTVLLEVCCHGRIYDMYTRTRYYYDAVKSKTKIFYTNQKRNHIFCSTKYCWCMAPENLGCCSIFDVFIRPFGQRVHIGMSYDWRITKKKNSKNKEKKANSLKHCKWLHLCLCDQCLEKKKGKWTRYSQENMVNVDDVGRNQTQLTHTVSRWQADVSGNQPNQGDSLAPPVPEWVNIQTRHAFAVLHRKYH